MSAATFLRSNATRRKARRVEGTRVYFIQAGNQGPIKVGFTVGNSLFRLNELQVGNPYPLKLLGEIEGGLGREHAIHELFAANWLRGEWFTPTTEVVETIDAMLDGTFDWSALVPSSPFWPTPYQPPTFRVRTIVEIPAGLEQQICRAARIAGVSPQSLVIDMLADMFAPSCENSVPRETGLLCEAA